MSRPTLGDPAAQAAAELAVKEFAAELQRGGDTFDADLYDRSFAEDVLWGSPYGATLAGFAPLNAIHHHLMESARGATDPDAPPRGAPPSRFEVVSVLAPAPGVAVAQIRRQAATADGFSEMALYVLVQREGRWWLAAAQNTPIRTPPAS
ncbi:DUF4440 domain-containing protein [Cryptosporangium minutisporangium]|uniref:DUF4440 domain-containing protein n=1 Tax=Cryptosporangium minutisporangium TaxID=113569 RepID=A0ABP6SPM0_9ACTN